MFKFLKDKLKSAVSIFSKKVEKEASEEVIEKEKEIQLDEKTIAEEEKKIEEEQKKKEEELKKLEKKRKEEAEKEKAKEKEEKKREEEQSKKETEIKKLEEEKNKKEVELRKAKEEEKLKKEAEIRRLEEEKKEKEEERDELEEERKREGLRKLKEEEKERKEEEAIKKKEEELEQIAEKKKEIEEKKGFFSKLVEKLRKKKEIEKGEVLKGEEKELVLEEVTEFENKGFFAKVKERVTTKKITPEQFDELFWGLELALLENNVAVEVVEKIKEDLKKELVGIPLKRSEIETKILQCLKKSIESLFEITPVSLVEQVKYNKKPYIILFVGVNGSGKTTTLVKIAYMMLKNGLKPIIAASDTFRAAAIQQLEEHGKKLGVKVVKHDYGADPSAVAFDAIKAAKAHNLDVVLIDTAGRMHSNANLVDEMKKIVRVTKPNMKIFVGEAITGNDAVTQSQAFDEAIDIDGIILAKSDIDEKGGAIVSISYVTGKPILYLGTGQGYDDLEKFDPKSIMSKIGL